MINREELIAAYLDGELDSEEHKQVTQMLAEDPASQELLASFQKLRADLRSLPNYEIDGDLTDQVLGRAPTVIAGNKGIEPLCQVLDIRIDAEKQLALVLISLLLIVRFLIGGRIEHP